MVGFLISLQFLSVSSDMHLADRAGKVQLNYSGPKLIMNILIETPTNSRMFQMLFGIIGVMALVQVIVTK